ncbi:ribonuclease P protein component [Sulfurimonas sp. HSL1-2]|uniref:ribonuclease P protein component n=1 Tax=Thiomicrolovo zhangzhouensis TaxID=3131933 RepID=UPI0031F85782
MLKHNREFQLVYRKGKSAHSPALVLFYLPNTPFVTVGFTASKKVGNAVKRNRAKRRMRALFYGLEPQLAAGSYILVAKATTVDTPYAVMEKALRKMVERVGALQA